MSISNASSCYHHGTPMCRKARRKLLGVYGPVDPAKHSRRLRQGWQPHQPHRRPSSKITTTVK